MYIARWSIDVRYGHKDEFYARMKRWMSEVGTPLGWKARLVNGSVGTNESRIELEITLDSLDALEKAWMKLAKSEGHQRFGKDIESLIVSGSNRWEVFRLIDL
jgi:hypothetical protein